MSDLTENMGEKLDSVHSPINACIIAMDRRLLILAGPGGQAEKMAKPPGSDPVGELPRSFDYAKGAKL